MNTLERRQFVKANVIDASIACAAVNESRRQRADAAKRLRKDIAAKKFASRPADTVSYPFQGAG